VLFSLNANNSPDLTDAERQELYKKAREAVTGKYGLEYGSPRTIPGNASVLLSLNANNSPDLTDAQRQELYKKAREAVTGKYGLEYGSPRTIPGNASVLLSLNANNSPDLTDAQRQELYKKAREAVTGKYGLEYGDHLTIPANAMLLLGAANLGIDLREGFMTTGYDLPDETMKFSSSYDSNDIVPGIPDALLVAGAISYGLEMTTPFDPGSGSFGGGGAGGDWAMGAKNNALSPGGIDLNAKNLSWDIAKDSKGIDMKFDPAMIAEFQRGDFSGIVPVIISIKPIASALPILGLAGSQSTQQAATTI
jgi:hypothetical protein